MLLNDDMMRPQRKRGAILQLSPHGEIAPPSSIITLRPHSLSTTVEWSRNGSVGVRAKKYLQCLFEKQKLCYFYPVASPTRARRRRRETGVDHPADEMGNFLPESAVTH